MSGAASRRLHEEGRDVQPASAGETPAGLLQRDEAFQTSRIHLSPVRLPGKLQRGVPQKVSVPKYTARCNQDGKWVRLARCKRVKVCLHETYFSPYLLLSPLLAPN